MPLLGLPAHSSRRARGEGGIDPPSRPRRAGASHLRRARLASTVRAEPAGCTVQPVQSGASALASQPTGRASLGRTGGQGGPATQKVTVPPAFPQQSER